MGRSVQLVLAAALAAASIAQAPPQCGAEDGQGKCALDDGSGSYQSRETGRGAVGAHTCGAWCASAALDPATPCTMDESRVPCSGSYWCTSTCGLWNVSVEQARSPGAPGIACAQFIRTSAFPVGAEPCDPACLLDEIKPDRYPAPTGLGLLCAPSTCDPAVQVRYRGTHKALAGLAALECPCNWFGSDCPDEWEEVTEVRRKQRLGDLEVTVLGVSVGAWHRIMADHRPGGVVRLQAPSPSAWGHRPLEQPYALATDAATGGTPGELEILTGLPEARYHPTVTEVARRVRALPEGPVADGRGPLFVNPSVGGFFNSRYVFLSDLLDRWQGGRGEAANASGTAEGAGAAAHRGGGKEGPMSAEVEHAVLLATGAGLSGLRSVLERFAARPAAERATMPRLHLLYGLRDAGHLPYREALVSWASSGVLELTLVVSSRNATALEATEPEIAQAVARGEALRRLARPPPWALRRPPRALARLVPRSSRAVYAQHALGAAFAAGNLKDMGASLGNTVVVICGRNELLRQTHLALGATACPPPPRTPVPPLHTRGGGWWRRLAAWFQRRRPPSASWRGLSSVDEACDALLKERVFTNI